MAEHATEKTAGYGSGVARDVLPIPDRPYVGLTTFDAKDPETSFPAIEPLRPPEGAPNVLLILLDDVGFAAGTPFGGGDRHAGRRAAR
jgi:arylsulfatase